MLGNGVFDADLLESKGLGFLDELATFRVDVHEPLTHRGGDDCQHLMPRTFRANVDYCSEGREVILDSPGALHARVLAFLFLVCSGDLLDGRLRLTER